MSDTKAPTPGELSLRDRTRAMGSREEGSDVVRCDACPVICRIRPGRSGACGRYANEQGRLARTDPLVLAERVVDEDGKMVPFLITEEDWDGSPIRNSETFVTGIGSGTTYPDYKPAPLIVSSQFQGLDTITVVTEGIFSYCGLKVKIDTDRHIGAETTTIRARGEAVGHVTTAEYGSQMLSIGGVRHLTGGSKKEGSVTCDTLLALCNRETVDLAIDGGSQLSVGAGHVPIIDGVSEERMRVGCGSATVGIFARQWQSLIDEVVVLDDHITGVLSEHQAGKVLDMPASGIRMRGRRSTPGRYFNVAKPGSSWGGTDIDDPLSAIRGFDARVAWTGLRLLVTSTTGEDAAYYELDESLSPVEMEMPVGLRATVERIRENCEPARSSVVFMAGAGGSLRAGATENPVRLTRSVHEMLTKITMGGAPVYLWPGGGMTVMVDVERMPEAAFGSVPTPAIVAPIEFTLPREKYEQLGGHKDHVVAIEDVLSALGENARKDAWVAENPWPLDGEGER